jgi:hypothetical protein
LPNYRDDNLIPVLYFLSSLWSNFYVQTLVDKDDNQDYYVMSNRSIFMRITNAF